MSTPQFLTTRRNIVDGEAYSLGSGTTIPLQRRMLALMRYEFFCPLSNYQDTDLVFLPNDHDRFLVVSSFLARQQGTLDAWAGGMRPSAEEVLRLNQGPQGPEGLRPQPPLCSLPASGSEAVQIKAPIDQAVDTGAMDPRPSSPATQPVASDSLLFSRPPKGNRAVTIKTPDGQTVRGPVLSTQHSTQAPGPSPLQPARSPSSETLASSTAAQPSANNDIISSILSLQSSPPTSRDASPPRSSVLNSTELEIGHDWENIRYTSCACEKCGHRQSESLWNDERYRPLPCRGRVAFQRIVPCWRPDCLRYETRRICDECLSKEDCIRDSMPSRKIEKVLKSIWAD